MGILREQVKADLDLGGYSEATKREYVSLPHPDPA